MPDLRLNRDGGLLTVTLDRPAARNALASALLRELTEVLRGPACEPGVSVVVLTGSDPAFCAGLDLKELAQDPQALIATAMDPATNPFRALAEVPVPTIAAVNGAAYTGGLELVLACDIAIASEQARFADTHAKVGVPPAQGMPALLSAAVGVSFAKRMSLTGLPVDAATALQAGLVTEVLPHATLLKRASQLAAAVQACDARGVRAVKALYDEGLAGTRAQWLALEQAQARAWSSSPAS